MSSPIEQRRLRLAASRADVSRLAGQPISEVTPSRRDFAQFVSTQKEDVAIIARLIAAVGSTLLAHASACDDAEVAALAIATTPEAFSVDDMAAVSAATTAPILRDDLLIDPSQLYQARLHGADAAVFPAADVDPSMLYELVTVAGSLHMSAIIEVGDAADLEVALRFPHTLLGLNCVGPDGRLDLQAIRQLAAKIPRQRTLIVLPEVRSASECGALRGICDAVVVGELLVGAKDLGAVLAELLGAPGG